MARSDNVVQSPLMMRFRPVDLSSAERQLREDVRSFLAAELPRGSFHPGLGMNAPKDPDFSRKLGERGWLGMALPADYGGHDRTAVDRFIVVEELLRWGAPVGHHWVADRQSGPVISKFGTDAQKRRFLPAIANGELSFCIGMSEPDSGSDLASISTKATRDGDGWVLEGHKIWTSAAHRNDWIIVLCRTTPRDEVGDKRQGLSQLIVDLHSPGLTATPIPFIDGSADFCEVVLDQVFVPDDLVLGTIGKGWDQNTSELAYERGGPDRWLSSYTLLDALIRREHDPATAPTEPNPALGDLLGDALSNLWVLHHLSLSVARSIDDGHAPAIESSLVKEMGTRFEQDLAAAISAYVSEPPSMTSPATFDRLLAETTLTQPSFTIRGGTNEVLRSVAAKGLRPSGGSTVPTDPGNADPMFVETVEQMLAAISTHEAVERAEQTGWSPETWGALAAAGFTLVGVPESAGGSGGTLHDAAAIVRSVGRHAAPVPIAESVMVGGWLMAEAGLTVPPGPIAIVEREVEIVGDHVRVHGFAAWARHADRIVALSTDGRLVSIPRDLVAVTTGANLAGEARDRVDGSVALAEVDHAPSGVSFQQLNERGALSRVLLSAGALETVAQMTIDYTSERVQFGKPIGTFQAVQHHLVTVAQAAVRARMAADIALRAAVAGTGTGGVEVAFARVIVDDAIALGTRAAHQAHGAMGMTREYRLHQFSRRLWSWRHEWGTTSQWRREVGEHARRAHPDDLFDLVSS